MQYPNAVVLQSLILFVTVSFTALTTSASPTRQQVDMPKESSSHSRSRRSIARTFLSAFPEDMRRQWEVARDRKSLTVAQMAMAALREGRQIGTESLISASVAQTFLAALAHGPTVDNASSASLHTGHQRLRTLILRELCRKLRESGDPQADRFCYFSGVDDSDED